MALTSQQEFPEKPVEKAEGWTFRKMFPAKAMASLLSKLFVSPYEILLGVVIFIICVTELVGRNASWGIYILAVFLLGASIFERHIDLIKPPKK